MPIANTNTWRRYLAPGNLKLLLPTRFATPESWWRQWKHYLCKHIHRHSSTSGFGRDQRLHLNFYVSSPCVTCINLTLTCNRKCRNDNDDDKTALHWRVHMENVYENEQFGHKEKIFIKYARAILRVSRKTFLYFSVNVYIKS